MKTKEKCYQIINTVVDINGSNVTKSNIVYYDEIGLEETRENYNPSDKIKDGYVPLYLTVDVPIQYDSLDNDIKNIYLTVINDSSLLDENGDLTTEGNEKLKLEIRLSYSEKISNISNLQESVERFVIDGTPIPQTIIDEREVLKTEYHNLISYLGI